MEITFKNAVIISVAFHSAIFLPVYNKNIQSHAVRQKDSLIVDYIKSVEPEASFKTAPKIEVPPKIEASPKVEMKQAISPPSVKAKETFAKDAAEALAAKQARIKSTSDYINYYQLIREKIRQKLKDRYRTYYGVGDTALIFVLRSDGKLISIAVDKGAPACDKMLINTAIQSVKEAAPFAPFPKALSLPQMSFTLAVSFKKE